MKNPHPPEFVVLYRWKLKAGKEAQFVESWSEVTALFREKGSLGSRLHKGPDGFLYGYAQWPSAQDRRKAFDEPIDSPWFEKMSEAVAESLPEVVLEPVADYLVLPRP
ncbi:MAG TPA: hypothetical protein VIN35_13875 [Hydrogenophaga sp.]